MGDVVSADIEAQLFGMATIIETLGQPSSLEAIVLEHGRRFEPIPLPDGVELGAPKNCFTNAMAVVLGAPDELDYRYVEGYCWRPGVSLLLFHHGWVTVDGSNVAIDPTLEDAFEYQYWGIQFETDYAVDVMERFSMTGLTLEHFEKETLDAQS
jgi:hypothetical protein